ncbi:MAG TPA: LLM class flavin-dependent oxidoreductase [Solirubrobacteraceae bacterium]|jgi:alkanesulfonate monooxygenase SsuD/methylene tetrahydromethanopterin reductase-like flavin-dependent oxidoreductase (luciferase family)
MQIALVVQGQDAVSWHDWHALADACEEHAVPTLLRSDHYQGFAGDREGALDAWGTVCALSAVTSRLRLGTLVSPVTFRPPAVLSKLVSTADHVSGGRIEIGLGAGWDEAEHATYGISFPPLHERMSLLEGQLRTLHEHWSADWYAPAPVQRPHPPVIVGGTGAARGLALAARWADEYNTPNVPPEDAARRREALSAACRSAGREPIRFSVMLPLVLAADRSDAVDRERLITQRLGRALDQSAVRGSVEDVIARLKLYEAAGTDRVILGFPLYRDLETIALLGTAVVPALT